MKENYYAFLICILRPVTIEEGFDLMSGKFRKRNKTFIINDDIQDMIRMKQQGMTYQEIGEIFGLTKQATYRRIKRIKEKRGIAV